MAVLLGADVPQHGVGVRQTAEISLGAQPVTELLDMHTQRMTAEDWLGFSHRLHLNSTQKLLILRPLSFFVFLVCNYVAY